MVRDLSVCVECFVVFLEVGFLSGLVRVSVVLGWVCVGFEVFWSVPLTCFLRSGLVRFSVFLGVGLVLGCELF